MDTNIFGGMLAMEFGMIILVFIIGMIALVINIALLVMVYKMAEKRHREGVLWLLLGVLTSPIVAAVILLIVGDDTNHR